MSRVTRVKPRLMTREEMKRMIKESPERQRHVFHQEGDGIIRDLVDKVLPTRQKFPPKVRKILQDYGNKKITSITVGRTPVQSMVTKALNFLTGGKFNEQIKKLNYDDVYHLFMLVGLEGGTNMLVEKNSVVNFKPVPSSYGGTDKVVVPVNKSVTLGQMVDDAVKAVGPSIYLYDAVHNNCQKFVSDLLKNSGLMNPSLNTFINQDIEKVLSTSPGYAKKIADVFTEGSAKIDRLLEGEGKRKKKISSNSKMPIHRGKNFYQFGNSGKKYYYTPGDVTSRKMALSLAQAQGRAIESSKNGKRK